MPRSASPIRLSFHPLTRERWADFESLFGSRGACGGCWCMWWRLHRADFERHKGEANRKAMKRLVDSGEITGMMAYAGRRSVGWCAVAPREAYARFENSRILAKVDGEPVWSVVCFFVEKAWRHRGLSVRLLEAAVDHAAGSGGRIIEGYPVEPKNGRSPDAFVFTGLAAAFRKAGFRVVMRRSETRPVMRFYVEEKRMTP